MALFVDKVATSSLDALTRAAESLAQRPGVAALLVLLAEGGGTSTAQGRWPLAALDQWARASPLPVIGGLFPYVLHGREVLTEGGVLVGLRGAVEVHTVAMCEEPSIPPELYVATPKSVLVLLDGLSPHIANTLYALYDALGPDIAYAGGGCGSLTLQQQPCVLTPHGLLLDRAVVALLPDPLVLGVHHGWTPLYPDLLFKATDVEGNRIRTLNWHPAFEVYRELLAHAGISVARDHFFDVAKAYPLALVRPNGELIVRDPIRVEGDALVCVGPIPEQAKLTLLCGDQRSLLTAAEELSQEVSAAFQHNHPGREPSGRLIFDCVSRFLFLGEKFSEELARLVPDEGVSVGALTLGEIASRGTAVLTFYNKTAVLAEVP